MCLSTEDIHLIKSAHTCNQACRRSHRRETPNHVRAVRARMRIHCETCDSHEECERDKASDEPFHIGTSMMNIFLAYTLVALRSHVFVIFTHFCRITIPQSDERAHTQAHKHSIPLIVWLKSRPTNSIKTLTERCRQCATHSVFWFVN